MAHLTLAGLSDDGKRLLLVSDKGVEFTLDADERLRAALRGDHARLGQLEIKMDSALRPRDIQARIRAGETPEAVAQAAHTTVEAIMPFAAPVIAERQHVADRAQRSSVRRTGTPGQASSGGARTLGDAVGSHLRAQNVDPETVDWDAARREDGKWALTGAYSAGGRSGIAKFIFDAPGNYVVVDNDDAVWLLGDAPAPAAAAAPAAPNDDISRARARRQAVSDADQLPLGDDAISMVAGTEQDVDAYLESAAEPAHEPPHGDPVAAETEQSEDQPEGQPEEPAAEQTREDEPASRRPAKKRGRASVPSWDEIMFGGGKSE